MSTDRGWGFQSRGQTNTHVGWLEYDPSRQQVIEAVVAKYPKEFGLRHFPKDRFRIAPEKSFIDTHPDQRCADGQRDAIQIVIQILGKDGWADFLRCGAHELVGEVVK